MLPKYRIETLERSFRSLAAEIFYFTFIPRAYILRDASGVPEHNKSIYLFQFKLHRDCTYGGGGELNFKGIELTNRWEMSGCTRAETALSRSVALRSRVTRLIRR